SNLIFHSVVDLNLNLSIRKKVDKNIVMFLSTFNTLGCLTKSQKNFQLSINFINLDIDYKCIRKLGVL
ncbi:hypothetical protein EFR95_07825, partial [Lactobacillus amylovorus]|nr:hypothetical protein [Lactobacillus amylovorus]